MQAPPTPRPPQPAPTKPHGSRSGALADLGSVLADLRGEIEQEAGVEGSVTISWQVD